MSPASRKISVGVRSRSRSLRVAMSVPATLPLSQNVVSAVITPELIMDLLLAKRKTESPGARP